MKKHALFLTAAFTLLTAPAFAQTPAPQTAPAAATTTTTTITKTENAPPAMAPAPAAPAAPQAAPALFGVKEVLLQFTRGGNKAGEACNFSDQDITAILTRALKQDGVPAIPIMEAGPANAATARIELVPEVAAVSGNNECHGWIALTAQGPGLLRVAPVDAPRNLTITYWRSGQLISTSALTFSKAVAETLTKLARAFAQQYRIDQPPALPTDAIKK